MRSEGAPHNSSLLILLKNPVANFDLSAAVVLLVIVFIDACSNGEKILTLCPHAGVRFAISTWKASRLKYRFTLQAAPMK